MYPRYVSYPASNPADGVDQTGVTHKTLFANGQVSQEFLVTNPTAAESSWAGPTTVYNWDSSNHLLGVRLPGNPTTGVTGMNPFWTKTYVYDPIGDVTSETTNVLDATQTTIAQTRVTTYAYDANGHHRLTLKKVKFQDSPTVDYQDTQITYDNDPVNGWKNPTKREVYADSNANNKTSSNDRTTLFNYTFPSGSYPGRVYQKTDARENVWTYGYDNWGNLTQQASPTITSVTPNVQRTVSYGYDATAHLLPVSKTDSAGQMFSYTYHTTDPSDPSSPNPDWRVKSVSVNTSGTPTNSYHWTANGQLMYSDNNISGGGSAMPVQRAYLDGGLLASETQPGGIGPWGSADYQIVYYQYDPMGRRITMYFNNEAVDGGNPPTWYDSVTYGHDGFGHLTSEFLETAWNYGWSAPTISYQYDNSQCSCASGRLVQSTNSNGTYTLLTYNNLGEETQREIKNGPYPAPYLDSVYTVQRRPDGLTTEMDTTGGGATTRAMSYDVWGEMTEEDTGPLADKRSFGYDANGNRTGFTAYQWGDMYGDEIDAYDEGNQTKSRQFQYGSPVDLSSGYFDGNGNTTTTLDTGNDGAPLATCAYYPDNRMKSMEVNSNTEGSQYDGAGRLAQRTEPGGSSNNTAYGYDGSDCILDYNFNVVDERMYGLASQYIETDANGSAQAFVSYDPMGNAAVVTDANGNPTYCSSELYGNLCSPQSESNFLSSWGYRYRQSANLFQVGARVYDPGQGRFLQQDPLSFGSGDFTYAANSPANAVDPTGLFVNGGNCEAAVTLGAGTIIAVGAYVGLAVATAGTGGAASVATGAVITGVTALGGLASGFFAPEICNHLRHWGVVPYAKEVLSSIWDTITGKSWAD